MNQKSRSIVRSYLTLTGLYTLSASLIWGVNTLFLLDAGLRISQVFFVNAIFTGAMAVFEIPTGVIADTKGRRVSFLLSIGILILGTLGYVASAGFTNNLWLFALMSIVLGLGYTFYSGAMEAWLVDALKSSAYSGGLDEIFSRSGMISAGAMLIGSITGGILGTINLGFPFLVRAVLLAVVFIVAFLQIFDLGFKPRGVNLRQLPREMKMVARDSITYGYRQPSIRLLMITGFVQALFMAWGFYAWQPYFLELLGRDVPWVAGVIAALISLATMIGNWFALRQSRQGGRRTSIFLFSAVVLSVAVIGVGLAKSFLLAVGFYLIVMLMMGLWTPVKQAYIHQLIPSEQRATVISFDSLVSNGGSVFGQTILGQVAERQSIAMGYVLAGMTTTLVWPVIWMLRKREDPADIISGKAGQEGACAAQGLPQITSIDIKAGVDVK